MSNFNLRPIPKEIRYKLLQKQKAFARLSIEKPSSANEPIELGDDFLNFHNRATWAHMIGLTVITGDDNKQRIAIIGAGELNQEPGVSVDGVANEPLDLMKSSFDSIYSNTLYRPISGIKSISTRYEGTLKSRRECTVNFTVFSLEDLDRLSPYFFRVGSEVLVEFGWNVASDKDTSMFNTSLGHKIIKIYNEKGVTGLQDPSITDILKNNTAERYEREILSHNGDYEFVKGLISMFEYSLRSDGGFDCVVKVQTIGMSLLDTKVDREYSPSTLSTLDEDKKPMFTLPDDPSDEFYLMMHNLPEIIYGSLIQKHAEWVNAPAPPPPQKSLRDFTFTGYSNYLDLLIGNGIDAKEAAVGLMGGWNEAIQTIGQPNYTLAPGMPTDLTERKENQTFVLALMAETVANGWDFWTDYEPLVAVYQEALLEQGYELPVYGPDGGWGAESKAATVEFLEAEGEEIFIKFIKDVDGEAQWINEFGDEGRQPKLEKRRLMMRIITTKGMAFFAKDDLSKNMSTTYLKSGRAASISGGNNYGHYSVNRYGKFIKGVWKNLGGRKLYGDDLVPLEEDIFLKAPVGPSSIPIEKESEKKIDSSIVSKFYKLGVGHQLNRHGSVREAGIISDPNTPGYTVDAENKPNAPEKYITIFTSYRQGNITQIFTGFNWKKSKVEFDSLSEIYAGETYRDNLIVPKTEKQIKAAEKAGVYGRKFKSKDTDEFLEFVDPDGTVPPKIWIRWGWFEDNILTRYLGYTPDGSTGGSPISLFKSVEPKIEKEGVNQGKVIPGYESNKIGLPGPLLTTDVNQIIIPDRVETLENTLGPEAEKSSDRYKTMSIFTKPSDRLVLPEKGEVYNFYGSLGTFLKDSDNGIPAVEVSGAVNENYKVGYIRNLYVEAYTLQEAFLNIGTLREGVDRFISIMYNNFGKIHQLEVQQGRDDNMIGIVDTNLIYNNAIWKNIPPFKGTLKDEANKINVFEFPAWEKESIVKSQDLKVTIPNEMALTALYSGNEHIKNLGIYDESRGSLEAQKLSKFLRLDHEGKDVANQSVTDNLIGLTSVVKSKNLTISGEGKDEIGLHKYNSAGDMVILLNKELSRAMGSKPNDNTGRDVDQALTRIIKPNISLMKSMFKDGPAGLRYYNSKGTLEENAPFNMRRLMEYQLQYHGNSAVQNNYPTINGLLDLSLTIDGTAGIFPGNSYISKYLPKAWQARITGEGKDEYPVLFQATDVAHEISSDGWNTTLTGMPRMNPKAFPYEYNPDFTSDGENENARGPETAISDYYNFFNLNHNFVKYSLKSILLGINPLNHQTTNGAILDALTKETPVQLRSGEFESVSLTKYANFTAVYDVLKDGTHFVRGKIFRPTYLDGDQSKISSNFGGIPERSMKGLEVLLFLQMSMIISGLSYYGLSELSVDKAFYNEMLADTDFQTHRPDALQKMGNMWSIPVSQEKTEKGEKILSREYFTSVDHGALMNIKGIKHTNYFYSSISPFMWSKNKYFTGDDVPPLQLLIGPAKFTPPGAIIISIPSFDPSQPLQIYSGPGSTVAYPSNDVVHIHESIFKTILKNEFGVDSWREFDKIIGEAIGFPVVGEPGSVLEAETILAQTVDSEELFKYALECEYLIKTPGAK